MGKYPKRVIQWAEELVGQIQLITEYFVNRRIPNGTYGGVRGRGLVTPSYSIPLTKSRLCRISVLAEPS
jgi:hypothetical protein